MKNLKYYLSTLLISILIVSCSKDEVTVQPEAINEEEVITTMTITLAPTSGSSTIVTLKNPRS